MSGKSTRIIENSKNIDLLNVLPEGCIATAISFTDPQDASRFATVSKLFKSAADSDSVWSHFLPSDYLDILSRASDSCCGLKGLGFSEPLSKKHLFMFLSQRYLLIDGNTKSFFLDKSTGKKCITVSAKELAITWGDTPRYWAFHPLPESRFPEVAELKSVCWLEIVGRIKTSLLSLNTTYVVYLVFKMEEAAYGFYNPAKVTVRTKGGKSETRKVYLQYDEGRKTRDQRYQIIPRRVNLFNRIRYPFSEVVSSQPRKEEDDKMIPKERKDGWLEVEMGEFSTRVDEDEEIEMSVLDIEGGNWKSGLIVEGIEIRPKVCLGVKEN